jgi:peptidoglycan/xylan/chitin deacetylase (PgdA/CDA1 family)
VKPLRLVDDYRSGPARDFIGYGRRLPKVVWPDGARVAITIVINWEEGSERSIPAGDGRNEIMSEMLYPGDASFRDLFAESVYEYGSRVGIWRIQRLLDEFGLRATFSGCAVAYERTPEVGAYVQEGGHEPCAHGWRWEELWQLTREEEEAHMRAAIASIEQTCGQRPLGWNSRYSQSVHTRELLVEEGGFIYDADAYNDDLPYFVDVRGKRHLVIPYSPVYNDSRFILPQGFSDPSSFVDYCKRGFDWLWREAATTPRMMSIGIHPRISGQPSRISALHEFIYHALETGDVWFAPRIDIARWWLDHHEEFGP